MLPSTETADEQEYTIDSLYKAYVDELYSYAVGFGLDKAAAMDAIHDVFCRICARKENCVSLQNPRFYLFRALRNQLIDYYKYESRRGNAEALEQRTGNELPYRVLISIEDEMIAGEERREIEQRVEEILECLNPRQREIIYLRFVQGYSYEEISQILHIAVPSCRKSVSRAVLKLKRENKLMLLYLLLSINIG